MQSEGLRTEAWEAPARGAAHGTAASQHSCQAVTQRGRSRDGRSYYGGSLNRHSLSNFTDTSKAFWKGQEWRGGSGKHWKVGRSI